MSLVGVKGTIKHLRINDSAYNQPYGPPNDAISTQVIVEIAGSDKYLGLEIRPGPQLPSRLAMLAVLRDAFIHNLSIGLAYEAVPGKLSGMIMRIDLER